MALIEVNYISKALMRTVEFRVVLPADKLQVGNETMPVKMPFKTLYLLHGGYGNNTDYISGTRIQRWAEEKNLAVIMPSGENQFYVDKPETEEYYGAYVAQELVEFTRRIFPLSTKREDTFIAGLSMGGYGAIVNGLKYADTFGYIGAFSAGLILDDIIEETTLIKGIGWPSSFYDRVFAAKDKLKESDRDYCYLMSQLIEKKREIPKIYLAIGTEDFLYQRNQEYRSFLKEKGVDFTYAEEPGSHEWDFWDRQLKRFIDWLPLDEACQGLNSGNVRCTENINQEGEKNL